MPKLKLSDADRVILASAGARESGLVLPVPKSLKLSVAELEPILRRLLGKDLLLERPLLPDERPWVISDDGQRMSLIITSAGLEAVGLGISEESASTEHAPPARRKRTKAPSKRAATPTPVAKPKAKPIKTAAMPDQAKATTKLDTLIVALRQRKGATIEELMEATGWQAHSVRGAISGALKNKKKLNVASTAVDGRGRVYRISE